jgi:SAM-dependent methyltransferase
MIIIKEINRYYLIMQKDKILKYFESLAKNGGWDSLYDPRNPKSYSFIVRLKKSLDLLDGIENKTVCDLGCGTGVLIPFILERGGNYIGVDNSENMLDQIRVNFSKELQVNKLMLIFSDFENLLLENKCNVLIGLGFIEYFNEPEEILKKTYEMLPEGGQLILSFPNFFSLDYFLLKLLAPFRFGVRLITDKGTPQPPRKLWTIKKTKKIFLDTGYKDLKIVNYSINFFFYPFSRFFPEFCNYISKKLEYSFMARFSFFSTGFIISGRKVGG